MRLYATCVPYTIRSYLRIDQMRLYDDDSVNKFRLSYLRAGGVGWNDSFVYENYCLLQSAHARMTCLSQHKRPWRSENVSKGERTPQWNNTFSAVFFSGVSGIFSRLLSLRMPSRFD